MKRPTLINQWPLERARVMQGDLREVRLVMAMGRHNALANARYPLMPSHVEEKDEHGCMHLQTELPSHPQMPKI